MKKKQNLLWVYIGLGLLLSGFFYFGFVRNSIFPYALTETFIVQKTVTSTQFGRNSPAGWIVVPGCQNKNNGNYLIAATCEKIAQEYIPVSKLCLTKTPKVAQLLFTYTDSASTCTAQYGSSCNSDVLYYLKNNAGEYKEFLGLPVPIGYTDNLEDDFSGDILGEDFIEKCLDIYVAKYNWGYDGVNAVQNIIDIKINYDPTECDTDANCNTGRMCSSAHTCVDKPVVIIPDEPDTPTNPTDPDDDTETPSPDTQELTGFSLWWNLVVNWFKGLFN